MKNLSKKILISTIFTLLSAHAIPKASFAIDLSQIKAVPLEDDESDENGGLASSSGGAEYTTDGFKFPFTRDKFEEVKNRFKQETDISEQVSSEQMGILINDALREDANADAKLFVEKGAELTIKFIDLMLEIEKKHKGQVSVEANAYNNNNMDKDAQNKITTHAELIKKFAIGYNDGNIKEISEKGYVDYLNDVLQDIGYKYVEQEGITLQSYTKNFINSYSINN